MDSGGQISEDPLIDPVHHLILSAAEDNNYELINVATSTSPTFFEHPVTVGGVLDSSAEDCSTGIILAPAAAQHPVPGDQAGVREDRADRCHPGARVRQRRAIAHVDRVYPRWCQHPGRRGSELCRGQVSGRLPAGKNVGDHDISPPERQLLHHRPGISDPHPDPARLAAPARRLHNRQPAADQPRHLRTGLDRQLGRARPGVRDITGQRQAATAQVHHVQRRAGRGSQVDQVPQPAHVFQFQMRRIIKINMRLDDAIYDQHPRARPVEIPDKLHPLSRQRLARVRLAPGAVVTLHHDSLQAEDAGRGLPGATVRARIPSVARSALSGITGKMAASFQDCSAPDQS